METLKHIINPLPTGGVPFFNEDILRLQENSRTPFLQLLESYRLMQYEDFSTLGTTYNQGIILNGCNASQNGSYVDISEGYLYLNNKILYYPGGANLLWAGGGNNAVYLIEGASSTEERVLRNGINTSIYQWNDVTVIENQSSPPAAMHIRFDPMPSAHWKGVQKRLSTTKGEVYSSLNPIITSKFDTSSGLGRDEYFGFARCDGQNGTIDLRERFLAGYTPNHPDFDAIGKLGGTNEVTLSVGEMPAHNHSINDPGHQHNIKVGRSGQGGGTGAFVNPYDTSGATPDFTEVNTTNITINTTGSNYPHENRPAFAAVFFYQKLCNYAPKENHTATAHCATTKQDHQALHSAFFLGATLG